MQYFVPSDDAPPLRILAEAFPPGAAVPLSVARAAIEAYSRPGDVILDPFCNSVTVIQAALEAGRRIIAASFNPINVLAIEATLWPLEPRSALTHLADALKGAERLRDHVLAEYTTPCPHCEKAAVAQAFIWDRDQNAPTEKRVQCETCGEHSGPVDEDDVAWARRFEPRGLSFWLLLSRVIDRNSEDAERVSDVLAAYTPRNLSVIGDILLKFDGLPEAERAALRPALLAALDACTSLHAPEETTRPAGSLKLPTRFVEKNVWLELEKQCRTAALLHSSPPAPLTTLLASDQPAVSLLVEPARELAKLIPPKSIQLLLSHPPLPRPAFWSLSAVWTAWLWNKSAAGGLLPLLSHKRTNWDWQWRAIASALTALQATLKDEARSVMSFAGDESILESVSLAAAAAQHMIEHATCDPHDGVRLSWRPAHTLPAIPPEPSSRLSTDIHTLARAAAQHSLRDRAEPTDQLTLHAGIFAALGQSDLLAQAAHLPEGDQLPLTFVRESIKAAFTSADSPVTALDPHTWWLKDESSLQTPLADRVELALLELLQARAEWSSDDLLREIYRRFPDHLTPDRWLLAMCLHSYSDEPEAGRVRLRAEDSAQARAIDSARARHDLETVGQRLGFEVRVDQPEAEKGRVTWLQSGEVVHAFVITATAEIDVLLHQAAGVLVLPGGRATLLLHKIGRDVRLKKVMDTWQMLKLSSLSHSVADTDLSLNTFALAFGLEPPIEQAATQIRLW